MCEPRAQWMGALMASAKFAVAVVGGGPAGLAAALGAAKAGAEIPATAMAARKKRKLDMLNPLAPDRQT